MASPYKINIPLFEGPLDLLLDLIKKQEMNIHDIQIAKITSQYLDYLHQLEVQNIDVSAAARGYVSRLGRREGRGRATRPCAC